MRLGGRGVISLPIRLMIVFLILAISMPALMNVLEDNERSSTATAMEYEFSRFADSAAKAHYSGIGSTRSLTMDVPSGCEVFIGGDGTEAYMLRGTYRGETVIVRYMEQPPLALLPSFDGVVGPGRHDLTITSVLHQGHGAAEVRLI